METPTSCIVAYSGSWSTYAGILTKTDSKVGLSAIQYPVSWHVPYIIRHPS